VKNLFSLLFASCLVLNGFAQSKTPPNVIIIMSDDMGYGDVGFNGCKDIPTPNIDRIASNGVVFNSGHVSFAVCSPSRAGLLTGRYGQRFGYERNVLYVPKDPEMGLSKKEETIADVLTRSGYATMLIGKWHLGAHPDLHPLKRGFGEFYGFLGGGHQYFPQDLKISDPMSISDEPSSYRTKLNRNTTPVEESEYITDAFSREAVAFVDRNKQKPFFLYLAYNAPHTPLQATEKYLDRFQHITDKKRRTYAAMVSAIDDGVGLILDKLKQTGQDKNTLVIFLSDNGGPIENGSNNGDLNGRKGSLLEGGIRVPFAMQWPGKIPAGIHYEKPIISLDIFSTVLAQLPGQIKPKHPMDGVNLLPYLTGQKKQAPHAILFWRHYDTKSYAAITGEGKKLWIKGDSLQLFDLNESIREIKNIAADHTDLVKKIRSKINNWENNLQPPAFLGLSQRDEYFKNKK
jgi:arylsulfatase A-like enzyme